MVGLKQPAYISLHDIANPLSSIYASYIIDQYLGTGASNASLLVESKMINEAFQIRIG